MDDLRTEKSILSMWKNSMEKPLVSICCLSYNQEIYIESAIKGFINQETDFPFEILIHDDASTDQTAAIIKSYAKLYPSIIKPICQVENQYSKGVKVNSVYNFSRALGKYIALCEGDDYWIDNKKLSKQIKRIEELDTDICFTNALLEYQNDKQELRFKGDELLNKITISEVIRRGGWGMPTASLLIRSSILKNLPKWFERAPVGDYFIQMLGSKRNGAAYLDDVTSVYRVGAVGSWSSNRTKMTHESIIYEANTYEGVFNELRNNLNSLNSKDIDFALALEFYGLAAVSTKIGNFKLAHEMIIRSWQYYPRMSTKQVILMCLMFVLRFFGTRS